MVNNKYLNVFMVVLISIFLVFVTGCGKVKDSIEDKETDQIDFSWPEELMVNIPKYNGDISSVLKDDKSCSVIIVNTNKDVTDKYIKELENLGFKRGLDVDDKEIYLYSASREKDKDIIALNYIHTDNTLLISYTKE